MKKLLTMVFASMLSYVLLLSVIAIPAQAQRFLEDATNDAQDIAVNAGYSAGSDNAQGDLLDSVNNLISLALTFIGTILFLIFLYAGYQYMTAGGNTTQTGEAITWMKNSLIGLLIIFAAYGISIFVINSLKEATF